MNHRPFEEWLLDERVLTTEQRRELRAHLRTCPSCTALAEVNLALRTAHLISPTPGFSQRFRQRASRYHRMQQRRQAIGMLVFLLGSTGLLYWLAGPIVQEVIQSPTQWLVVVVQYFLFAITLIQAMSAAVAVLGLIAPMAGFLAIMLASALSLVWVLAIRHTTRPLQGV